MAALPSLLTGSVLLRPYVFGFLALYLLVVTANEGWRRAAAFTTLAAGLAFVAEWMSTRIGVPFGLYEYTGLTRGQELYLGNVPLFDPLSFSFLAYASLGLGRLILTGHPAGPPRSDRPVQSSGVSLAVATGLLMMWLDLVIDPVAVRGDRWFLGRVFFYPDPGWYFGIPATNFAGWAALGTLIGGIWLLMSPRIAARPPGWAARVPGRSWGAPVLYGLVLAFNLALAGRLAEPAIFSMGVALHLPLALALVFSVSSRSRSADGAVPAGEPA